MCTSTCFNQSEWLSASFSINGCSAEALRTIPFCSAWHLLFNFGTNTDSSNNESECTSFSQRRHQREAVSAFIFRQRSLWAYRLRDDATVSPQLRSVWQFPFGTLSGSEIFARMQGVATRTELWRRLRVKKPRSTLVALNYACKYAYCKDRFRYECLHKQRCSAIRLQCGRPI